METVATPAETRFTQKFTELVFAGTVALVIGELPAPPLTNCRRASTVRLKVVFVVT